MKQNRFSTAIHREKPTIHTKEIYANGGMATHLTKTPKIKIYNYYICDFCGKEIKIKEKWEESEGGIVEVPTSITKNKKLLLALHNRCLNNAIIEITKEN